MGLDIVERIGFQKSAILVEMIKKKLNAPLSTSCGRLFDGISSLLGIRDVNTYEGQAAVELENRAQDFTYSEPYPHEVESDRGKYILRSDSIIKSIVEDLKRQVPTGVIGGRFHQTIISCWEKACMAVPE